jgi:hypothetical protein
VCNANQTKAATKTAMNAAMKAATKAAKFDVYAAGGLWRAADRWRGAEEKDVLPSLIPFSRRRLAVVAHQANLHARHLDVIE